VRQRRDEAYVLGTSALGEADLIVTLLAEHQGRVRGVAASARKSRRRFGGALEPMTRVAAAWVEREGNDLHRIEALEPLRSYAAMQADPALQAACAVLAEITGAIVREAQADPTTFRLLGSVLDALEGGLDPWTAVRYTEYWLLKLHGVLPDLEHCAGCGEPFGPNDLRTAGPPGLLCRRCPKPEGGIALGPADRAALAAFDRTAPGALAVDPAAARPGGSLDALLRGALQAFAERAFRTYRHLRALGSATR
jgi:DNA repair protein RecO (recombination protein O)